MWRRRSSRLFQNSKCYHYSVHITPDVGATKHGPITKIPDKFALQAIMYRYKQHYVGTVYSSTLTPDLIVHVGNYSSVYNY